MPLVTRGGPGCGLDVEVGVGRSQHGGHVDRAVAGSAEDGDVALAGRFGVAEQDDGDVADLDREVAVVAEARHQAIRGERQLDGFARGHLDPHHIRPCGTWTGVARVAGLRDLRVFDIAFFAGRSSRWRSRSDWWCCRWP